MKGCPTGRFRHSCLSQQSHVRFHTVASLPTQEESFFVGRTSFAHNRGLGKRAGIENSTVGKHTAEFNIEEIQLSGVGFEILLISKLDHPTVCTFRVCLRTIKVIARQCGVHVGVNDATLMKTSVFPCAVEIQGLVHFFCVPDFAGTTSGLGILPQFFKQFDQSARGNQPRVSGV